MKIEKKLSLKIVFSTILLLSSIFFLEAAYSDNIVIRNWDLPTSSFSPDVRINTIGPDYFDATLSQDVKLIMSENNIYVRFLAECEDRIPNYGVKVTAYYTPANSGLTTVELAALDSTTLNGYTWIEIGEYTMSLVLSTEPDDNYLYSGDWFPREFVPAEIGNPDLYTVNCPVPCDESLPIAFFLKVTIEYTDPLVIDEYPDDNTAYSYYDLSAGTPPVDVVLVHDCSGSMMDDLDDVKESAKMFVDLMNINDRVGAVAFSSCYPGNIKTVFSLQKINTLDPLDPIRVAIKAEIDLLSISSGSCMTPMGAGLEEGRDKLTEPPAFLHADNQAIVLLTDGKENVSPKVDIAPYTIIDSLVAEDISLFPLWFGTVSDWGKNLLQTIKTEFDADVIAYGSDALCKLVDQPLDSLELAKAYLMIRGILVSDDVFNIHRGISDDGFSAAVQVDPVTSELILTSAWKNIIQTPTDPVSTRMVLQPQILGIEVIAPGEQTWRDAAHLTSIVLKGKTYVVYRMRQPASGTWQYRLKPNDLKEPYILAAMADRVDILMKSHLEKNAVRATEPLTLVAELTRNGTPLKGAVVIAEIDTPKKSLGTLLMNMRDKLKDIQATPGIDISRGDLLAKKLPKLLAKDKIIDYKKVEIKLFDDGKNGDIKAGDGFYTARFKNTTIAGTYKIKIIARNAQGTNLKFRRQHEHSAIVDIGKIDTGKSILDIALQKSDPTSGYNIWQVMVTPIDKWGNATYPGYGDKIDISASTGTWQGKLIDNEDGSYSRLLRLKKGQTAVITVTAYGEKLPTISSGKVAKPWQLSFHATQVFPTASFAKLVDDGYGFLFDVGYHFHPNFSLIGCYGLSRFPKEFGNGFESVHNVSLNIRARRLSGIFSLYAQAGPGIYRIFDQWDGGVNFGAGIVYPVTSGFELETGFNFHHILTEGEKVRFFQTHLGFNLRLN